MNNKEEYNQFSKGLSRFRGLDNRRIREILDERGNSLKKVEILACIIAHGGGELESEDFSSGSTVTNPGLKHACIINGVTFPENATKKMLLKALLKHSNRPYIEGDVIKKGSTVESVALLRVYHGLLDNN